MKTPLSPIKFATAFEQILAGDNNEKTEQKIEFTPYVPIKLQFLRKFTELPFNIYLQLRKEKHVKIRNAGETLEDDLISRYKSKGIKEFFLTLEDFHAYHDLIYNLPFISATSNPKNPEQHIKEIHEVLIEVIRDVGLNDVVIGLANQYAHSVLDYTGSKASLALMMEASIKNQYSYIYDHSYLTSVICAKVSNKISWMTTDLEEKICVAAVFHDLALSDTKYPYFIDVERIEFSEIPKKERKEYLSHPTEMATILRDSESISDEVITIVLQHHETIDGSGFPKKLSSLTMTPIVGLFIMVHDFVDELYRSNFDCQQYSKLVVKIFNKYDCGNFKEVAKAFKQTLKAEF
jgi:HD-GYP domain-containing protein (c-di-GMP phosphodiesterase class II)